MAKFNPRYTASVCSYAGIEFCEFADSFVLSAGGEFGKCGLNRLSSVACGGDEMKMSRIFF